MDRLLRHANVAADIAAYADLRSFLELATSSLDIHSTLEANQAVWAEFLARGQAARGYWLERAAAAVPRRQLLVNLHLRRGGPPGGAKRIAACGGGHVLDGVYELPPASRPKPELVPCNYTLARLRAPAAWVLVVAFEGTPETVALYRVPSRSNSLVEGPLGSTVALPRGGDDLLESQLWWAADGTTVEGFVASDIAVVAVRPPALQLRLGSPLRSSLGGALLCVENPGGPPLVLLSGPQSQLRVVNFAAEPPQLLPTELYVVRPLRDGTLAPEPLAPELVCATRTGSRVAAVPLAAVRDFVPPFCSSEWHHSKSLFEALPYKWDLATAATTVESQIYAEEQDMVLRAVSAYHVPRGNGFEASSCSLVPRTDSGAPLQQKQLELIYLFSWGTDLALTLCAARKRLICLAAAGALQPAHQRTFRQRSPPG